MFHDMGWGGMWFGWLFWLIIIGVIVWAVLKTSRNAQRSGQSHDPSQTESPMDILKKRYARGEINRDEFEQMKKDIQS